MKLEEIDLGYEKGMYTIAFVYSKYNGSTIIKGEQDRILELIKEEYRPCVAHLIRYKSGKGSSRWIFEISKSQRVYIIPPRKPEKYRYFPEDNTPRQDKFEFHYKGETKLKLCRIPKRWIPEYDKIFN